MHKAAKLLQQAIALHQSGQLTEAERTYVKLLRIDKNNSDGLRLLGCLYLQTQQSAQAYEYLTRAHKFAPQDAEILNNRGIAARNLDRLEDARKDYLAALALRPDYPQALHNLGSVAYQQGKLAEATEFYRWALRTQPHYAQAHYNLANTLRDQNLLAEAVAHYEQALMLDPQHMDALVNLALVTEQMGELEKTHALYDRALALRPDHALALNNFGNFLRAQGGFAPAKKLYEQALQAQPDYLNALINLGTVERDLGNLDAAETYYRQVLARAPDNIATLSNLGTLMQDFGRLEEAAQLYERALQIDPHSIEALWNKGLAQLAMGHYAQGWRLYDVGLGIIGKRGPMLFAPERLWKGGDLHGKRLLIWSEQGLGDALHFIRYAALCKQCGGEIYVLCAAALAPLFKNDPAIDKVYTEIKPQEFDVHIPIMSLPRIFGVTLATIPNQIPYLSVSAEAQAKWMQRLADFENGRLKVGLVWAGGIREHQPFVQLIDKRRSMRLEQFVPLFEIAGIDFYTLQIGSPAAQIKECGLQDRLIDLTDEIKNFEDTAALVQRLDLVIAVDTSIVHLAGGLGKPVWVLSRLDACWRWLRNRPDSPWYPTARVFGQSSFGAWGEVVGRVCKELESLVAPKT